MKYAEDRMKYANGGAGPTEGAAAWDDWKKYVPAEYLTNGEGDYSGTSFAEGIDENSRVLTIEEQREVAFKVVFFFIGLIAASFGVLYIYHRMTQAN